MRHRLVLAGLLIAAALLPVPMPAQVGRRSGVTLGFGAGLSSVHDSRTGEQGSGATFNLRAGYTVVCGVSPMMEVSGHRMFDERLPIGYAATSPVLKSAGLIVSVQMELPGSFYVRPGFGSGIHAFVDPDSAATEFGSLYTDHETGRAASLAVGRTIAGVLAVEGSALWTRGGKISGNRLSLALQLVVAGNPRNRSKPPAGR